MSNSSYKLMCKLAKKYHLEINFPKSMFDESYGLYEFRLAMDTMGNRRYPIRVNMLCMKSVDDILPEFCIWVDHPLAGKILVTAYPKTEYTIKRVRMSKYKKKGVK